MVKTHQLRLHNNCLEAYPCCHVTITITWVSPLSMHLNFVDHGMFCRYRVETLSEYIIRKVWVSIKFLSAKFGLTLPPEKVPKLYKSVENLQNWHFFPGGGGTLFYGQNDFMDIWVFLTLIRSALVLLCMCLIWLPPQYGYRSQWWIEYLNYIELFRGCPWGGNNLTSLFEVFQTPLFKTLQAPFLTLRVATPWSRKRKTREHKQICGIISGFGGWQKFVYVPFFGSFLMGEKEHIKFPQKSRDNPVKKLFPCFFFIRKEPEGKNAKGKNFWKLRGRKKRSRKIFQKISQKIEDITFTGFYSISGYLRNLRGRLLSSEKFSEVFTLWVFTLKPFPVYVFSSLPTWGAAREAPLDNSAAQIQIQILILCYIWSSYLPLRTKRLPT